MPTNKDLVKAQNGFPAQNYNPTTGAYEEAHSENNTPFVQDKDAHTRLDAIEAALGGTLNTQLTGSSTTLDIKDNRDLRGLAANKPDATTVTIGATYWSIDTDPNAMKVEVSDGTQWKVME